MRVLCHLKLHKNGQIQQESGARGGARWFYSGQVVYVVEPVNSVFCSSNNVYSVFFPIVKDISLL